MVSFVLYNVLISGAVCCDRLIYLLAPDPARCAYRVINERNYVIYLENQLQKLLVT